MKYYTLRDLESILHLTRRTLQSYVTDGKLPAHKVGRQWLVEENDLQDFINGKKPGQDDKKPQSN